LDPTCDVGGFSFAKWLYEPELELDHPDHHYRYDLYSLDAERLY
jgi:hypothetical protein